jgi:hypothetical protein
MLQVWICLEDLGGKGAALGPTWVFTDPSYESFYKIASLTNPVGYTGSLFSASFV